MLKPKVAHRPSVTLESRRSSCSSIGSAPIRLSAMDGASRHSPNITAAPATTNTDGAEDEGDRHPDERTEQQRGEHGSQGAQRDGPAAVGGHLGGEDLGGAEGGQHIERRQGWGRRQCDGGAWRPAARP